jgi:membrane protein YqaA with SNARE-associated domain
VAAEERQHVSDVLWFAGWAIGSTVLITPIPQEPVIFYGATLWPPLTVAVAMTAASCVSAVIDYRLLFPLSVRVQKALAPLRASRKLASWFLAAPFWALVAVNLLPIPLSPFKVACIATGYPLARFELALLLGRGPRYFALATVGHALDLSVSQLTLIGLALLGLSCFRYRRLPPALMESRHG